MAKLIADGTKHCSQRLAYEMSGGGSGLHWDALDEDICVGNLLPGIGDRTTLRAAEKR